MHACVFVRLWAFLCVFVHLYAHAHAAERLWFKTQRWKRLVITGKRICLLQKYLRNGTWHKLGQKPEVIRCAACIRVVCVSCCLCVCVRKSDKEGEDKRKLEAQLEELITLVPRSQPTNSVSRYWLWLASLLFHCSAIAGCGLTKWGRISVNPCRLIGLRGIPEFPAL